MFPTYHLKDVWDRPLIQSSDNLAFEQFDYTITAYANNFAIGFDSCNLVYN